MNDFDQDLTQPQKAAIKELQNALSKCHKAGVILFDCGGIIRAINGKGVRSVLTFSDMDRAHARLRDVHDVRTSRAWAGSFADDEWFIELESGGEK